MSKSLFGKNKKVVARPPSRTPPLPAVGTEAGAGAAANTDIVAPAPAVPPPIPDVAPPPVPNAPPATSSSIPLSMPPPIPDAAPPVVPPSTPPAVPAAPTPPQPPPTASAQVSSNISDVDDECNESDTADMEAPSDLILLGQIDRPNILNALHRRFDDDLFYTSIGPILVAVNPFKWMTELYTDEVKQEYASGMRSLSEHPHVFGKAYDALYGLQFGKNQSLIISGESGAGKTEATKQCLSYLAFAGAKKGKPTPNIKIHGSHDDGRHGCDGDDAVETPVQTQILQASPVLEAWGNAKTLRNDNSSRFGKYIEIWFHPKNFEIVGASNTTYLLEKSRIIMQEKGERNYHAFYQLIYGAPKEALEELYLTSLAKHMDKVEYLNKSGCLTVDGINEVDAYNEVQEAFRIIGFTANEVSMLSRVLSGVLHMGMIKFMPHTSNSDEIAIDPSCSDAFEAVLTLFGLSSEEYKRALLFKKVQSGRRASCTYSPLTVDIAVENSNALAKEVYSRAFNWIVKRINELVNSHANASTNDGNNLMVGILDIFGFEIFVKNSFEQLCINLANEALQRHFNENIFQREMDMYKSEDIKIPELQINDNQDVLDLILSKPGGIIAMLDEEGIVPRGSIEGFLSKLQKKFIAAPHKRIVIRPGTVKEFTVNHFAGAVKYDPMLFMVKNKDTLSKDLAEVFTCSSVPFFSDLFPAVEAGSGSSVTGSGGGMVSPGKGANSNKQTVGSSFKAQLQALIASLDATDPHYIRCIKPNHMKRPDTFMSELASEQLMYSGVFDAVVIMQNGYPFRLPLKSFMERYHCLVLEAGPRSQLFSPELKKKSQLRKQCMLLIELIATQEGCHDSANSIYDCHAGKTMIFYKAPQHRLLDLRRKRAIESAVLCIQKYLRRFLYRRLVKNLLCYVHAAIELVKASRDHRELQKTNNELRERCERLARVSSFTGTQHLPVYAVVETVAMGLEQLESASSSLLSLLSNRNKCLEDCSAAHIAMNAVKQVHISLMFEATTIEVKWDKDPKLVQASATLALIEEIVAHKGRLIEGINTNDDLMLADCVHRMNMYRQNGDIDSQYCKAEILSANSVLKTARELFEEALTGLVQALQKGQIIVSRVAGDGGVTETSFGDVAVKTSFTDLDLAIEKYRTKNTGSDDTGVDHKPQSKKLLALLHVCSRLRQLRQWVEEGLWQLIWDDLPSWRAYTSTAATAAIEETADDISSHIVHDVSASTSTATIMRIEEVSVLVRSELSSVHVAALTKLYLIPRFPVLMTQCRLPAIVGFGNTNNVVEETSAVAADSGSGQLALASALDNINSFIDFLHGFSAFHDTHIASAVAHLREQQMVCREVLEVQRLNRQCAAANGVGAVAPPQPLGTSVSDDIDVPVSDVLVSDSENNVTTAPVSASVSASAPTDSGAVLIDCLQTVLTSVKTLTSKSHNILQASHYLFLLRCKASLLSALTAGSGAGGPGVYHFSFQRNVPLKQQLAEVHAHFAKSGDASWTSCEALYDAVLAVRELLAVATATGHGHGGHGHGGSSKLTALVKAQNVCSQWQSVLTSLLPGAVPSTAVSNSVTTTGSSNAPNSAPAVVLKWTEVQDQNDELVGSAAVELTRLAQECNHLIAVHHIEEALVDGRVKGDVGDIDASDCRVTALSNSLVVYSKDVIVRGVAISVAAAPTSSSLLVADSQTVATAESKSVSMMSEEQIVEPTLHNIRTVNFYGLLLRDATLLTRLRSLVLNQQQEINNTDGVDSSNCGGDRDEEERNWNLVGKIFREELLVQAPGLRQVYPLCREELGVIYAEVSDRHSRALLMDCVEKHPLAGYYFSSNKYKSGNCMVSCDLSSVMADMLDTDCAHMRSVIEQSEGCQLSTGGGVEQPQSLSPELQYLVESMRCSYLIRTAVARVHWGITAYTSRDTSFAAIPAAVAGHIQTLSQQLNQDPVAIRQAVAASMVNIMSESHSASATANVNTNASAILDCESFSLMELISYRDATDTPDADADTVGVVDTDTDTDEFSVEGLLQYCYSTIGVHPAIIADVQQAHRLLVERKCRIVLSLAICTGCVGGTVGSLSTEQVDSSLLVDAIAFTNMHINNKSTGGNISTGTEATDATISEDLSLLLQYAQLILNIRMAVTALRGRQDNRRPALSTTSSLFAGTSAAIEDIVDKSIGGGDRDDENGWTTDYSELSNYFNVASLQSMHIAVLSMFGGTVAVGLHDGSSPSPASVGRQSPQIFSPAARSTAVGTFSSGTAAISLLVSELVLIIDYLRDNLCTRDLQAACRIGGMEYYRGTFDSSRVSYSHIISVLEAANELPKRSISNKLDRLIFYAELCIMLRRAILSQKWDYAGSFKQSLLTMSTISTSSSEGSNHGSSSNNNNSSCSSNAMWVGHCLERFDTAQSFFKDSIPGVPSAAMMHEFGLVALDYRRRLLILGFQQSFRSDGLTSSSGSSGGGSYRSSSNSTHSSSIVLRGIRVSRLQEQIARAHAWNEAMLDFFGGSTVTTSTTDGNVTRTATAAVTRDAELMRFVKSAAEVISIRQSLIAIHESYYRPLPVTVLVPVEDGDEVSHVGAYGGLGHDNSNMKSVTVSKLSSLIHIGGGVDVIRQLAGGLCIAAVADAVTYTSQVLHKPYNMVSEWTAVTHAVASMDSTLTLANADTHSQIDLITAETFNRNFIGRTVQVLQHLSGLLNGASGSTAYEAPAVSESESVVGTSGRRRQCRLSELQMDQILADLSNIYHSFEKQYHKHHSTRINSGDNSCSDIRVEFLVRSVVILSNLMAAVRNNCHDAKVDRYWNQPPPLPVLDENEMNEEDQKERDGCGCDRHTNSSAEQKGEPGVFPRKSPLLSWNALESKLSMGAIAMATAAATTTTIPATTSTTHTIEDVVRASRNHMVHSIVQRYIDIVIADVEDTVTYCELSQALLPSSSGGASGTDQLEWALSRVTSAAQGSGNSDSGSEIDSAASTATLTVSFTPPLTEDISSLASLVSSCRLVCALRKAVWSKDFKSGLWVIHAYILAQNAPENSEYCTDYCNIKSSSGGGDVSASGSDVCAEMGVKQCESLFTVVYSGLYSVHVLVATEVADNLGAICTGYWKASTLHVLTCDCIRAVRVSLRVKSNATADADSASATAPVLSSASASTVDGLFFCNSLSHSDINITRLTPLLCLLKGSAMPVPVLGELSRIHELGTAVSRLRRFMLENTTIKGSYDDGQQQQQQVSDDDHNNKYQTPSVVIDSALVVELVDTIYSTLQALEILTKTHARIKTTSDSQHSYDSSSSSASGCWEVEYEHVSKSVRRECVDALKYIEYCNFVAKLRSTVGMELFSFSAAGVEFNAVILQSVLHDLLLSHEVLFALDGAELEIDSAHIVCAGSVVDYSADSTIPVVVMPTPEQETVGMGAWDMAAGRREEQEERWKQQQEQRQEQEEMEGFEPQQNVNSDSVLSPVLTNHSVDEGHVLAGVSVYYLRLCTIMRSCHDLISMFDTAARAADSKALVVHAGMDSNLVSQLMTQMTVIVALIEELRMEVNVGNPTIDRAYFHLVSIPVTFTTMVDGFRSFIEEVQTIAFLRRTIHDSDYSCVLSSEPYQVSFLPSALEVPAYLQGLYRIELKHSAVVVSNTVANSSSSTAAQALEYLEDLADKVNTAVAPNSVFGLQLQRFASMYVNLRVAVAKNQYNVAFTIARSLVLHYSLDADATTTADASFPLLSAASEHNPVEITAIHTVCTQLSMKLVLEHNMSFCVLPALLGWSLHPAGMAYSNKWDGVNMTDTDADTEAEPLSWSSYDSLVKLNGSCGGFSNNVIASDRNIGVSMDSTSPALLAASIEDTPLREAVLYCQQQQQQQQSQWGGVGDESTSKDAPAVSELLVIAQLVLALVVAIRAGKWSKILPNNSNISASSIYFLGKSTYVKDYLRTVEHSHLLGVAVGLQVPIVDEEKNCHQEGVVDSTTDSSITVESVLEQLTKILGGAKNICKEVRRYVSALTHAAQRELQCIQLHYSVYKVVRGVFCMRQSAATTVVKDSTAGENNRSSDDTDESESDSSSSGCGSLVDVPVASHVEDLEMVSEMLEWENNKPLVMQCCQLLQGYYAVKTLHRLYGCLTAVKDLNREVLNSYNNNNNNSNGAFLAAATVSDFDGLNAQTVCANPILQRFRDCLDIAQYMSQQCSDLCAVQLLDAAESLLLHRHHHHHQSEKSSFNHLVTPIGRRDMGCILANITSDSTGNRLATTSSHLSSWTTKPNFTASLKSGSGSSNMATLLATSGEIEFSRIVLDTSGSNSSSGYHHQSHCCGGMSNHAVQYLQHLWKQSNGRIMPTGNVFSPSELHYLSSQYVLERCLYEYYYCVSVDYKTGICGEMVLNSEQLQRVVATMGLLEHLSAVLHSQLDCVSASTAVEVSSWTTVPVPLAVHLYRAVLILHELRAVVIRGTHDLCSSYQSIHALMNKLSNNSCLPLITRGLGMRNQQVQQSQVKSQSPHSHDVYSLLADEIDFMVHDIEQKYLIYELDNVLASFRLPAQYNSTTVDAPVWEEGRAALTTAVNHCHELLDDTAVAPCETVRALLTTAQALVKIRVAALACNWQGLIVCTGDAARLEVVAAFNTTHYEAAAIVDSTTTSTSSSSSTGTTSTSSNPVVSYDSHSALVIYEEELQKARTIASIGQFHERCLEALGTGRMRLSASMTTSTGHDSSVATATSTLLLPTSDRDDLFPALPLVDPSTVDCSLLEAAVEQFKTTNVNEWRSVEMYQLRNTCEVVLAIRGHMKKAEWVYVYDTAEQALDPVASKLTPIHTTAGYQEVVFARDYAAYALSRRALVHALSNNALDCPLGKLNTSMVSAHIVQSAIKCATRFMENTNKQHQAALEEALVARENARVGKSNTGTKADAVEKTAGVGIAAPKKPSKWGLLRSSVTGSASVTAAEARVAAASETAAVSAAAKNESVCLILHMNELLVYARLVFHMRRAQLARCWIQRGAAHAHAQEKKEEKDVSCLVSGTANPYWAPEGELCLSQAAAAVTISSHNAYYTGAEASIRSMDYGEAARNQLLSNRLLNVVSDKACTVDTTTTTTATATTGYGVPSSISDRLKSIQDQLFVDLSEIEHRPYTKGSGPVAWVCDDVFSYDPDVSQEHSFSVSSWSMVVSALEAVGLSDVVHTVTPVSAPVPVSVSVTGGVASTVSVSLPSVEEVVGLLEEFSFASRAVSTSDTSTARITCASTPLLLPVDFTGFPAGMLSEVAAAKNQLFYIELLHTVLASVLSGGGRVSGIPGKVAISPLTTSQQSATAADRTSSVVTEAVEYVPLSLEVTLQMVSQNPKYASIIANDTAIKTLLRDANLLVDMRRHRLVGSWTKLEVLINKADRMAGGSGEPPILQVIWSEIVLIKADLIFHTCRRELRSILATPLPPDEPSAVANNYLSVESSRLSALSPAQMEYYSTQIERVQALILQCGAASLLHVASSNSTIQSSYSSAAFVQSILQATADDTSQNEYNAVAAAGGLSVEPFGSEFDRLIETQRLALDLFLFHRYRTYQLPRKIIEKTGLIQREDERKRHRHQQRQKQKYRCSTTSTHVVATTTATTISDTSDTEFVSYIEVLVPFVEHLKAVFKKDGAMKALEGELVDGQSYMMCPIGAITTESIVLHPLSMAIDVAKDMFVSPLTASLSSSSSTSATNHCDGNDSTNTSCTKLVGTVVDMELLLVAETILRVREGMKNQNWTAVATLINSFTKEQSQLTSTYVKKLVQEEVTRVSIEINNYLSCEILSKALAEGRVLDVFALAAMVHQYKQLDSDKTMSAVSRKKMRQSIVGMEMVQQQQRMIVSQGHKQSQSQNQGAFGASATASSALAAGEAMHAGILALKQAIVAAESIQYKTEQTTILVKTSKLILALREYIHVDSQWSKVEFLVNNVSCNDIVFGLTESVLPKVSVEELRVAKAALNYRHLLWSLSNALTTHKVCGKVGQLDITSMDYNDIQKCLFDIESLHIEDEVLGMISELALVICNIRRAIKDSRWFAAPATGNVKARDQIVADSTVGSIAGSTPGSEMESGSVTAVAVEITMDNLSALSVQELVAIFEQHEGRLVSELQSSLTASHSMIEPESDSGDGSAVGNNCGSDSVGGASSVAATVFSSPGSGPTLGLSNAGIKKLKTRRASVVVLENVDINGDNPQWKAVKSVVHEIHLVANEIADRRARALLIEALTDRGCGSGSMFHDESTEFVDGVNCDGSVPEEDAAGAEDLTSVFNIALLEGRIGAVKALLLYAQQQPPPPRATAVPSTGSGSFSCGGAFGVGSGVGSMFAPISAVHMAAIAKSPLEFSIATLQLLNSAELILRFRKSIGKAEIHAFKELILEADSLMDDNNRYGVSNTNPKAISAQYGVQELMHYLSVAGESTFATLELQNGMQTGKVTGLLDGLRLERIEHRHLKQWIDATVALTAQNTDFVHVGDLKQLVQESQLCLELRQLVKAQQWEQICKLFESFGEHVVIKGSFVKSSGTATVACEGARAVDDSSSGNYHSDRNTATAAASHGDGSIGGSGDNSVGNSNGSISSVLTVLTVSKAEVVHIYMAGCYHHGQAILMRLLKEVPINTNHGSSSNTGKNRNVIGESGAAAATAVGSIASSLLSLITADKIKELCRCAQMLNSVLIYKPQDMSIVTTRSVTAAAAVQLSCDWDAFTVLCDAANNLLLLWQTLSSSGSVNSADPTHDAAVSDIWDVEEIAAGNVYSCNTCASDALLSQYLFQMVAGHEVANRMSQVHEHLLQVSGIIHQLLHPADTTASTADIGGVASRKSTAGSSSGSIIHASSDAGNSSRQVTSSIRSKIRSSVYIEGGTGTGTGTGTGGGWLPPPQLQGQVQGQSHMQFHRQSHAEDPSLSAATDATTTVSAVPGSFTLNMSGVVAPIAKRKTGSHRVSIYRPSSLDADSTTGANINANTTGGTGAGTCAGPALTATANTKRGPRRGSIGGMALNGRGLASFTPGGKKATVTVVSAAPATAAVAPPEDIYQPPLPVSTTAAKPLLLTVPQILCDVNWARYPSSIQEQFNTVRDVFLDKIVCQRLLMCCAAGGMKAVPSSVNPLCLELAISADHTDILSASIAEAEKILRRSRQMEASLLHWSQETEYWIKVAKYLVNCRLYLLDGDKVGFLETVHAHGYCNSKFSHIESYDDHVRTLDPTTAMTMTSCAADINNYTRNSALRACKLEYDLIEIHGWECLGESLIDSALNYLIKFIKYMDAHKSALLEDEEWHLNSSMHGVLRRRSTRTHASIGSVTISDISRTASVQLGVSAARRASHLSLSQDHQGGGGFAISAANTDLLLAKLLRFINVTPYVMMRPTAAAAASGVGASCSSSVSDESPHCSYYYNQLIIICQYIRKTIVLTRVLLKQQYSNENISPNVVDNAENEGELLKDGSSSSGIVFEMKQVDQLHEFRAKILQVITQYQYNSNINTLSSAVSALTDTNTDVSVASSTTATATATTFEQEDGSQSESPMSHWMPSINIIFKQLFEHFS